MNSFPNGQTIIRRLKNDLKAYLLEGDVERGFIGLDGIGDMSADDFQGLRFCLRQGQDAVTDPTLWARAAVVLQDQDLPGVPCARITLAGSEDDRGPTGGVAPAKWSLRIDFNAQTAEGLTAVDAEDDLAAYVRRMLRSKGAFFALRDRGFMNSQLRLEGELSKDGVFRNPMTLTFTTQEDEDE